MTCYYKSVRLDHTSHYDAKTLWVPGEIVRVTDFAPPGTDTYGRGLHCSPRLPYTLDFQRGNQSEYCEVEPLDLLDSLPNKVRCSAIKCVRYLTPEETDELAGFKLWEANHPVNPLLLVPEDPLLHMDNLRQWASVGDSAENSVWDSVRDSVGDSVGNSVWVSVGDSVGDSVWYSVRDSVGNSVWVSVDDSVGAYVGGLFPGITTWREAESLGPDPWRPLLNLWYAGLVPSFDGTTWRLHGHADARVLWQGSI